MFIYDPKGFMRCKLQGSRVIGLLGTRSHSTPPPARLICVCGMHSAKLPFKKKKPIMLFI